MLFARGKEREYYLSHIHLNGHTPGFDPQTQMLEPATCKAYEHHLKKLLIQDILIEWSHALQSFIFTYSKVISSYSHLLRHKVLLSSFYLNDHSLEFVPQTQKLEPPCKTYKQHLQTLLIQEISFEWSHALQNFRIFRL